MSFVLSPLHWKKFWLVKQLNIRQRSFMRLMSIQHLANVFKSSCLPILSSAHPCNAASATLRQLLAVPYRPSKGSLNPKVGTYPYAVAGAPYSSLYFLLTLKRTEEARDISQSPARN